MTKKEVAKQLRSKLSAAIRALPDVDYQNVSVFEDATTQMERDHEANYGGNATNREGAIHVIELTVEEARREEGGTKEAYSAGFDDGEVSKTFV